MKPLLAFVLTFALSTSTITALAATHEWPQWLGPQRNGLTDETGLMKSWPEGGPEKAWMSDKCGLGYSGPAIVDGTLFIMGARDDTEYLLAFNAETGDEMWAAELGEQYQNGWGDGPRGTPTVDGGRVYALGAQGALVCVDANSGSEIWRTTMQEFGGVVPRWGYSESVLVDGDMVLCTPGGKQGAIVALDKSTGRLRWQSSELDAESSYSVDNTAHYSSIVKASFHGNPQYVQLLPKRLVGLDPENGRVLWETPWPGETAVIPTPIIRGNSVYATAGYNAGSQRVEIGPNNEVDVNFDERVMENHHGGVILLGDYLYGHSNFRRQGWTCQDFKTGERVWNESKTLEKGAIAYADGMLYCLGEDSGDVVLIEASPDGWNERGRFTLSPQTEQRAPRGKIWTHPVIVNGKLYLRDQELLFCFDVKE